MGTAPLDSKAASSEDRAPDLVRYFVERLSGRVGRTRLAKLLYLADLEARRYLGQPLTRFVYRKLDYGPFDPQFYQVLDFLKERGEVREDVHELPEGCVYRYHAVALARPHPFGRAEEAILTHILSTFTSFEGRDLEDFLDVVYETRPMRSVEGSPHGTSLPMEEVDNEARIALGGVSLEDALLAEEEARQGKTVRWEDLRSELLDRARRTSGGEAPAVQA